MKNIETDSLSLTPFEEREADAAFFVASMHLMRVISEAATSLAEIEAFKETMTESEKHMLSTVEEEEKILTETLVKIATEFETSRGISA